MALTLHGTVANNTAVLSRRNANPLIINGDMAVAQRGTSFTSQTGVAYHLDRYEVSGYNMGDGVYRVDQSTDVPAGQGFVNSNKISCTTADTSQDANNQFYFQTQLEGTATSLLNYFVASPDTVSIAFWVRSNRTGTHSLALKLSDNGSIENNTATRVYNKLYTISSANTWEKIVCAIPLDSSTSETKVTGTGFAVSVQFWMGAGTNRDGAAAESWIDNGNSTTASANEDMLASTSNDWYITGLQMEVGDFDANSIPPFQHESYGDNLARCERYCQSTFSQGTAIGAATAVGILIGNATATYGGAMAHGIMLRTVMRAVPTIVVHNQTGGTTGSARRGDSGALVALASGNASTSSIHFENSVGIGDAIQLQWQFSATAEL
tara:strand:+ start:3855 stop:4994 length:1140 start_codon:yes stop_codon:yes gene_type:complete